MRLAASHDGGLGGYVHAYRVAGRDETRDERPLHVLMHPLLFGLACMS